MTNSACAGGERCLFSAKVFLMDLQSVLHSADLDNGNEVLRHSKIIMAAINKAEAGNGIDGISRELARRFVLLIEAYCRPSLSYADLSAAAHHLHEFLSGLIFELDGQSAIAKRTTSNAATTGQGGPVSMTDAMKKKARRALLLKRDLSSLLSDPVPAA